MAGVHSREMMKNIISYIIDGYGIKLEDESKKINKFSINYDRSDEDESSLYLNWRNSGEILIGDSISYDFKYSVLNLEDDYYILLENYNYDIKNKFITEVDLNLGMFIFLFKDQQFYPRLNEAKTEDEVVDLIDIIDEDYKYHNFNQIRELFCNIKVLKIIDDCPFDFEKDLQSSVERILSLVLVERYRKSKFTYFTEDTLSKYEEILIMDISYFPYENLLGSLLENKPSKVFLEIYRIIERLYPYIMIKKFKEKVSSSQSDILDTFELEEALKSINWKHNEEDSIRALFEFVTNEPEEIKELKKKSFNGQQDTNVAVWIYRIRNSIVHLSLKSTSKDVDVKKALENDKVILFILSVLPNMYQKCFSNY